MEQFSYFNGDATSTRVPELNMSVGAQSITDMILAALTSSMTGVPGRVPPPIPLLKSPSSVPTLPLTNVTESNGQPITLPCCGRRTDNRNCLQLDLHSVSTTSTHPRYRRHISTSRRRCTHGRRRSSEDRALGVRLARSSILHDTTSTGSNSRRKTNTSAALVLNCLRLRTEAP